MAPGPRPYQVRFFDQPTLVAAQELKGSPGFLVLFVQQCTQTCMYNANVICISGHSWKSYFILNIYISIILDYIYVCTTILTFKKTRNRYIKRPFLSFIATMSRSMEFFFCRWVLAWSTPSLLILLLKKKNVLTATRGLHTLAGSPKPFPRIIVVMALFGRDERPHGVLAGAARWSRTSRCQCRLHWYRYYSLTRYKCIDIIDIIDEYCCSVVIPVYLVHWLCFSCFAYNGVDVCEHTGTSGRAA